MSQFSRYRPLVGSLADQALARVGAVDWEAVSDDTRLGLPAARVLLHDAPADAAWHAALARLARLGAATGDARPLRSPGGQWRDVYWPLVIHLYLRSYGKARARLDAARREATEARLAAAVRAVLESPATGTISFRLWRAVCELESGGVAGMEAHVVELLARDDARPPVDALHAQDDDEPLDFWTYRELAGLHALHRLAQLADRADWHNRVAQVAAFHLHHTQPDYTTYEPWGFSAFAASLETGLFAEQQLHDATVHLAQRDGGGAATIALLLADAFDGMEQS